MRISPPFTHSMACLSLTEPKPVQSLDGDLYFTDLASSPTNNISVNINEDLQSWLNDDNIISEATLPENFRCIISGPSEFGKTFLLKKLILASIYFDKLYIIGPTGDQYQGTCFADKNISCKSVEFI